MPAFYGKPLVLIFSIATAVCLIFERVLGKKGFINVPQNILMLGLFFAVIMSHVVHGYLGGVIESVQVFYVNVILFFIILNSINTERKFKFAVWFIIILIAIMAIQGINQTKIGYGLAGQPILTQKIAEIDNITGVKTEKTIGRITWIGIFEDPNDLSLTFVIAIGLLLALLFGKTNIFTRLICLPLLALFGYGIYLTNSRGGLLAFMATTFFYFVRRSKKIVLGAIIGAIFVVGIFAFGPSRAAFLSSDEASANNRVQLWYKGIKMVKSNPVFGVGFRMFQEDLPQTAHNSYVLAVSELGLFGLFMFMGLLYFSFKESNMIQVSGSKLATYSLGLQAGFVGFCAAAFFLSRTYVILPYLLAALSGSLFYVSTGLDNKLFVDFKAKDAKNIALLCFVMLIVIFIVIKVGI